MCICERVCVCVCTSLCIMGVQWSYHRLAKKKLNIRHGLSLGVFEQVDPIDPQTILAVATARGYPPEPDGKNPLLKRIDDF